MDSVVTVWTKIPFFAVLIGIFPFPYHQAAAAVLERTFSRLYSTVICGATLVLLLPAPLNFKLAAFASSPPYPCMRAPVALAMRKTDRRNNFFLLLAGVASLWSMLWLIVNEIFSIGWSPIRSIL
jgi:hypothetical protein